MSLSPGMTDMVFRARRTLKVRSAETLPRSTNSVTYLKGKVGGFGTGCWGVGRRMYFGSGWGEGGGHTRTYTHAHKSSIRTPHKWQNNRGGGSRRGGWVGWGGEVGGVAEREEGSRGTANSHAQRTGMAGVARRRADAEAALPGITEIVFKALSTLNVRRAETLPRFTNSVIYLQD